MFTSRTYRTCCSVYQGDGWTRQITLATLHYASLSATIFDGIEEAKQVLHSPLRGGIETARAASCPPPTGLPPRPRVAAPASTFSWALHISTPWRTGVIYMIRAMYASIVCMAEHHLGHG